MKDFSQYQQDPTALMGQGDRIAALLRQGAKESRTPSFRNTTDALLGSIANAGSSKGAYDGYMEGMEASRNRDRQNRQDEIAGEQKIYDYMTKARQMGDEDTAKIKDGLDLLVGNDPAKQQQIISHVLQKYPGQKFDSTNYLRPTVEAMVELGIGNEAARKMDITKQKENIDLDVKRAQADAYKALAKQRTAAAAGGIGGLGNGLGKKGNEALDKAKGERVASMYANEEGARNFLKKVDTLEKALKDLGKGSGRLQGSDFGQLLGGVLETNNQNKRAHLTSVLRDLELDVAKMKLKGQGQVTEAERRIARETLPLQTNELQANLDIVANLRKEAEQVIKNRQSLDSVGGNIDQYDQMLGNPVQPGGIESQTGPLGLETLSDEDLDRLERELSGGQ